MGSSSGSALAESEHTSEVYFYGELNQARVVARREDASEVAGVDYSSVVGVDAAARGSDHVEIADRVVEVYVVEEIEKLSAKFKALLLT